MIASVYEPLIKNWFHAPTTQMSIFILLVSAGWSLNFMVLFPCEYLEFIRNLQTKTHAVLFQEIGAILILKSSNHWGKKVFIHHIGEGGGGGVASIWWVQGTSAQNKFYTKTFFRRKVTFTFRENEILTFTLLVLKGHNIRLSKIFDLLFIITVYCYYFCFTLIYYNIVL